VRSVSATARNIFPILDGFQAADWPERIDNPLETIEKLHYAIRPLRQLKTMKFETDGIGTGVRWFPVDNKEVPDEPPELPDELP
jgi:hypothetical protein